MSLEALITDFVLYTWAVQYVLLSKNIHRFVFDEKDMEPGLLTKFNILNGIYIDAGA